MCRLLGYIGETVPLDRLLYKPEHSLIVQSYQPREMTSGVVNADGFGMGWYHAVQDVEPFVYRTILPAWNDVNLPSLSRYIESICMLANVRSATAGQAVDVSNCQPFKHGRILGIHNGFIANFKQSLYRPIRERLSDRAYQEIQGTTDSEHIFALLKDQLQAMPNPSLAEALHRTINILSDLAAEKQVDFSANFVLSDGQQLVASRFASRDPVPSLYWLWDDLLFPGSVVIASEPLFEGNWISFDDRSILTVNHDLKIETQQI